jgi:Zn-finger nucleic acid-binding protein
MPAAIEEEPYIHSRKPCPRCDEEMRIEERGGERLDICPKCSGIWFDPTELDDLLGDNSSVELLIDLKSALKGENLKCPACREYMESKDIFGIIIDHCRECRGIWLDRDETQKIWAEQRRSLDPFELDSETGDEANFWNQFRVKYFGFEKEA